MKKVIDQEQTNFLNMLKLPEKNIAKNRALKENTFCTFVCVMNKIPILIIGCPGSSKSLSIRILASNFIGKSSESEIGTKYPDVNMIYFQGSESSTSEGIQQVFEKAKMVKASAEHKCLTCIYFD